MSIKSITADEITLNTMLRRDGQNWIVTAIGENGAFETVIDVECVDGNVGQTATWTLDDPTERFQTLGSPSMNTSLATEDQLTAMRQLQTRIRRADMFGKFGGKGTTIDAEIKAAIRAADGSCSLSSEQVAAFTRLIAEIEDDARREHGDATVDGWFRNEGETPRRRTS